MVRRIQIYADGADLATMKRLAPRVSGFTTNPSLMRKSGITNYPRFAREVLAIADGKPVSFEVLSDDARGIHEDALRIASWGGNVHVKVPIVNAQGALNTAVITGITQEGIKVNVTAIFTAEQAAEAAASLRCRGCILSVFAGRIADTGRHPARIVIDTVLAARKAWALTLWASARQVYSVIEAENAHADIITLTPDLIDKLDGLGRELELCSVETVRQFIRDADGISFGKGDVAAALREITGSAT